MRYLVRLGLDMRVADRLVLVANIPGDRREYTGTKTREPRRGISLSYSRRLYPFPNGWDVINQSVHTKQNVQTLVQIQRTDKVGKLRFLSSCTGALPDEQNPSARVS
jgi:hypothetical protein